MDTSQIAVTDDVVKIRHDFGVGLGSADVEARGEEVARVEAYSYSALVFD